MEETTMKNLIIGFVLTLLSVGSALAQGGRTFYKICESEGRTMSDYQKSSVMVKTLTDELIEFESVGTLYSASKVSDFDLMQGGSDVYIFYAAKVDADSFFVMQKGAFNGLAYFHADKQRGMLNDQNVRCALDRLVQFKTSVDSYRKHRDDRAKQEKVEFDGQTRGVITTYVKSLKSKRADPALERDVSKWWKNTDGSANHAILRIYFLQPSYEIVRNDLGLALRKTVDSLFVVKNTIEQRCWTQWRSFGYESLGGGAFDTEIQAWLKQYQAGFGYYTYALTLPGDRKVHAGSWYEVDCNAFAQP